MSSPTATGEEMIHGNQSAEPVAVRRSAGFGLLVVSIDRKSYFGASFVPRTRLALDCKTDEVVCHPSLLIGESKLTSEVDHKARNAVRSVEIEETRIP